MREDIFSKFNIKNYNNELEKILEAKDFSKDVKNLLLSMLYKVETSYEDYSTVKRNVENKSEFINKILENIKICTKIEFVNPKEDFTSQIEENKMFKINKEEKSIISFPNERSLLASIYYIGNEKMYLNEQYDYIRIVLPAMLNEGKDNNKVEIIRDFNAWSWNTNPNEISNIASNLIFQNLQILLGYDVLEKWMLETNDEDKIQTLQKKLSEQFEEEKIKEMLDYIYKIAISNYSEKNIQELYRLRDEYHYVTIEYNKIKNKKAYLSFLTCKKKELLEKIGIIDNTLKNDKLLEEEFNNRNEKLPKYSKLIDIEHLKQVLQKERRKAIKDIEEANKLMEPKNYVKEKEILEKQYNMLGYLDKKDISKELLNVQKIFLKCFRKKIENVENKKELIDAVYQLRYYCFIPYDLDRYIQNVRELKKDIEKTTELLTCKLEEQKLINKNISREKLSKIIISSIFETRIINLDQVQVEAIQKENVVEIKIYDNEELEKTIELKTKEEEKIKSIKKSKIFI